MLTIINFLRGFLEIHISGKFPERFLNICSAAGIAFWDLKIISPEEYSAKIKRRDMQKVTSLAESAMCTVIVRGERGAPFFLFRFKKRYIFIAGMLLCIVALYGTSARIWDFEVIGNETVSSEHILRQLGKLGVKPGVRAKEVDPEALEDLMLLRIKELSWFTVNVSGSLATVEVRERIPAPEVVDERAPCNIVAGKAGIIESISVLEGSAHAVAGDTITKGQLLVSGIVDNVSGARVVRAMAEIKARTWYTYTAKMPVELPFKSLTGENQSKYSLIFGSNRINFYFNSSFRFTEYDKIVERTRLTLPGGVTLPIVVERMTGREYSSHMAQVDGYDSEEVLKEHLLSRLERGAHEAEIVSIEYDFDIADGMLSATLTAECLEDIAVAAEIPIDGILRSELTK